MRSPAGFAHNARLVLSTDIGPNLPAHMASRKRPGAPSAPRTATDAVAAIPDVKAADAAPRAVLAPGLYVVATPIGNLSDLSLRAIDVLRSVDVVAAEDTRVTRVLLDHIGARCETIAAHEHNELQAAQALVARIEAGQRVALVSDAGTPAISDPGARIVAAAHTAGLAVVPVPGPAALTTIVSVAGFVDGRFRFEGFLATRPKARRERLAQLAESEIAVVLYESPHRIAAICADLAATLEPDRSVVIGRELTKRFEEIHRGVAGELLQWLAADPNRSRGEFVIVFEGRERVRETSGEISGETSRLMALLCAELPTRQAARLAAAFSGARANDLYRDAVAARGALPDDPVSETPQTD